MLRNVAVKTAHFTIACARGPSRSSGAPASAGHDHGGLEVEQFGNEISKRLAAAPDRPEFQAEVSPFNVAMGTQTVCERCEHVWHRFGSSHLRDRVVVKMTPTR